MMNELELNSLKEALEVYNDVSTLKTKLEDLMNNQMLKIMETKLFSPLRELFMQIELFHGAYITDIYSSLPDWGFSIIVPSWTKSKIQTDLEGVGQIYGIIHKDINNQVDQTVRNALSERLVSNEHPIGKNSPCWPWYQVLQKSGFNYVGTMHVYRETERIYSFFEKWLREVAKETKGLDL